MGESWIKFVMRIKDEMKLKSLGDAMKMAKKRKHEWKHESKADSKHEGKKSKKHGRSKKSKKHHGRKTRKHRGGDASD